MSVRGPRRLRRLGVDEDAIARGRPLRNRAHAVASSASATTSAAMPTGTCDGNVEYRLSARVGAQAPSALRNRTRSTAGFFPDPMNEGPRTGGRANEAVGVPLVAGPNRRDGRSERAVLAQAARSKTAGGGVECSRGRRGEGAEPSTPRSSWVTASIGRAPSRPRFSAEIHKSAPDASNVIAARRTPRRRAARSAFARRFPSDLRSSRRSSRRSTTATTAMRSPCGENRETVHARVVARDGVVGCGRVGGASTRRGA